MKVHRSISVSLAVGIVALTGACTSQPGTKAVTLDVIESLEGVSQGVRDCMTEVVEAMDEDELERIGKDNEDFNSAIEGSMTDPTPEMQAFLDDLAACNEPG